MTSEVDAAALDMAVRAYPGLLWLAREACDGALLRVIEAYTDRIVAEYRRLMLERFVSAQVELLPGVHLWRR